MEHSRESLRAQGGVKFLLSAMAAALFIFWSAPNAYSHRVHVFAWAEKDMIHCQGYFSKGQKAKDALIEVFEQEGNKLLDGRTNEKGEFSFKTPKRTDLKIVLTTKMGHRNDFVISAKEIEEASGISSLPERSPGSAEKATVGKHTEKGLKGPTPHTGHAGLTADEINSIVEKALDKKLAPLLNLMKKSKRQGPSFTEIIGGIGFIFGIMGVLLYFKSRKERR